MSDSSASDLADRARLYHAVMQGFVQTARAPHYTELARELGMSPAQARQTLHDLIRMGLPNWLHPSTDLIASFAPFSSIPTAYLVSVDGEQRWFAQCGLETMAISHLFPGKVVSIDSPCLDCNEPIHLSMRDGVLIEVDPPGTVAHFNRPVKDWRGDYPGA